MHMVSEHAISVITKKRLSTLGLEVRVGIIRIWLGDPLQSNTLLRTMTLQFTTPILAIDNWLQRAKRLKQKTPQKIRDLI
jgi:hypothetical protein